ncbi:MAG: GerAB/ArcD/ProY family transporter [Oscillospiraceae bacterium]|nr:GerAB/ArcD/ProY family transporter [Oscillospiraceae bacterium]
MKNNGTFQQNQLLALMSVAMFSPVLRLYPGLSAALAGRGAWLSPAAALPPMLAYAWLLLRFFRERREEEGLEELCLRALGDRAGRIALLLLGLWLLLYGAFLLRAGADRFVVTVFPAAAPRFFVISMGLAILPAALSGTRTLARMARLVFPPLLLLLTVLLLYALLKLDKTNLLPLTAADSASVALGALPVIDLLCPMLYLPGFLLGKLDRKDLSLSRMFLWLTGAALLMTALGAAVLGAFGAELTVRLRQPFFTLVRNLVFFRGLERIEALAVSFWIVPDFLLCALLLKCGAACLRKALTPAKDTGLRRFLSRWGSLLPVPCGLGMLALGLFLGQDLPSFTRWSERVIPLCNLAVSLLLIPGIYVIGRARKRL